MGLGAAWVLAVEFGASTLQRDLVVTTLSSKWADEHRLLFAAAVKTVKRYEDVQTILEVTSTCHQPQRYAKAYEVCRELGCPMSCIGAL